MLGPLGIPRIRPLFNNRSPEVSNRARAIYRKICCIDYDHKEDWPPITRLGYPASSLPLPESARKYIEMRLCSWGQNVYWDSPMESKPLSYNIFNNFIENGGNPWIARWWWNQMLKERNF